jgi:dimethylargininase
MVIAMLRLYCYAANRCEDSGIVTITRAITRAVGASLGDCLLTYLDREPIDVVLAAEQHAAYCDALRAAGAVVEVLPADDALPDSVFVEDVAVLLDEAAVLTRPGAAARLPEVASVATALSRYRQLLRIEPPGTIDGGDVLRIGQDFYVGRSSRTNEDGFAQFASIVGSFGYRATAVEVTGCLHLKSAVSALDAETLLLNSEWINAAPLPDLRKLVVPREEPSAADALVVNGIVHLSGRWTRTCDLVEEAGFTVRALNVSEFEKAEGAVTCLSLVFPA